MTRIAGGLLSVRDLAEVPQGHSLYRLFQVNSHPHVDPNLLERYPREILIALIDTDSDSMEEYKRLATELKVPYGTNEAVVEMGYRDYSRTIIFARDWWGTGRAEDDVLQWSSVPDGELDPVHKENIIHAREGLLGPPGERSTSRPVQNPDGSFQGGSLLERLGHELKVETLYVKDGRSLNVGLTLQTIPSISAPAAGGGKDDGPLGQENRHIRREVAQSFTAAAMWGANQCFPSQMLQNLEDRSELLNSVRVGCHENYIWPTIQINLAASAEHDSEEGLEELGQFGISHFDTFDARAYLSCFGVASTLQAGSQGGRFHCLEFGGFACLDGVTLTYFSGLRRHAGTPPLCPVGKHPLSWEVRVGGVLYAPQRIVEGTTIENLASMPNGTAINLSPEMADPRFEEVPTARGSTMNMVSDAVHLCDPTDVMDHVARGLYQLSGYVFRGLPAGWEVKQDIDAFLKTVTFTYNGETMNPRPWPMGRSGPPIFEGMPAFATVNNSSECLTMPVGSTSTDRNSARQAAFFSFAEQEHQFARLIPLVSNEYEGAFERSKVVLGPATPDAIGASKRKRESKEHATGINTKRLKGPQGKAGMIWRNEVPVGSSTIIDFPSPAYATSPVPDILAPHHPKRANILSVEILVANPRTDTTSSTSKPKRQSAPNIPMATTDLPTSRVTRLSTRLSMGKGNVEDFHVIDATHARGKELAPGHREAVHGMDDQDYFLSSESDASSSNESEHSGHKSSHEPIGFVRPQSFYTYADPTVVAKRKPTCLNSPRGSVFEDDSSSDSSSSESDEMNSADDDEALIIDAMRQGQTYQTAFLSSLTADVLDVMAKAFTDGVLAIARSSSKKVAAQALSDNLQRIMDSAVNDAMAETTAVHMASIWPLITKINMHADVAAVERRMEQRFIMLAYITAFNWMESIFRLGTTTPNDLWSKRLIGAIKATVNLAGTKAQPVRFASKEYIPSLHARTYAYPVPGFRWRTSEELDTLVNNAFYRIVSHWLGFPRQDIFRTRAAFALIVGTVFGDVLMLDEVWRAFLEPQSIVCGSSHRTKAAVTSAHFEAFTKVLHCHPYACMPSLRSAIKTLSQLRQMWQNSLQKLTALPEGSLAMTCTVPGDDVDSNLGASTEGFEEAKMASFLNYLVKVDESYNPSFTFGNSSSGNQKRLIEIQADRDRLSPFRDRAPCREHLLKASSRVLKDIHTRAGFYSLIVARAIFYRADAFFASDGYFEDLMALERFVQKHQKKKKEWFCNRRAYGSACAAMSLDNAAALWKASEQWEPWLVKNRNFTFTVLYNFLKQKVQGVRLFPSVGELIAMVIAADITCTHIGTLPTIEETGSIIASIGKGARDCLVHSLKLIPEDATPDQTKTMVVKLYRYIDKHLTDEQKIRMGFHGLMMEHGMCKYKRVHWNSDEII